MPYDVAEAVVHWVARKGGSPFLQLAAAALVVAAWVLALPAVILGAVWLSEVCSGR